MKTFILLSIVYLCTPAFSQILDSNFVYYFDNASGDSVMNTAFYKEFTPAGKYFWTVNSPLVYFGGNVRRFPLPDSTDYSNIYAQFISKIDTPGNYLVYNFS